MSDTAAANDAGTATYLLIHGGGSSARYWDRLLPHLDRPALAVDLPGRGDHPAELDRISIDDEVASIVADVQARIPDGPIIVVAHSSGGLVVPGVVDALGGRVVHIVLNAALAPREGERGLDCMKDSHRDGLIMAVEMADADGTAVTLPGAPDDPEPFRTAYGGDPLDDDTLAYLTDPVRCVPDTVHHYFQPVHWSTVAHVPVTYVLNERDRPVRPERQDEMITWLPTAPTVVRLDSGHMPAVVDPAGFAKVLRSVTQAI
jgi:pimeloyl-ACP methyl ester carboxylesterase